MPWPLIPVVIDIATKDDAGAWADAIANSPRLQASDYHTGPAPLTSDGGTTPSPALAHCCDCDLWLQPHESCLHIPALPSVAQGSREGVCPSPSALPADDSASSAGEAA
jgi:hypothetical protein